jgi:hypothetical protein
VSALAATLEQALEELVRRVVDEAGRHCEPLQTSAWLDVKGAAQHLSTTPSAIHNLVKRRQIPYHKPYGRLLFDPQELDRWVRGEL